MDGCNSWTMKAPALSGELKRSATRRIARNVARLQKRGIRSRGLIGSGRAATAILDHAGKSADLIVMETHGRTGFSHLFMGSVAEKVVRGARCPVLTVRESHTRKATSPSAARKRRR